jgi:DNA-binding transcriptional LysR family regulator
MDIETLRTFLEVNRTRHFGQAAKNLYVSQSAVSARIKLLEERIGAPLFTRTRNDIHLTPVGQKLVRYADNIVNSWNRARQDVTLQDELREAIVVGGMPSLWDITLQNWLQWTCIRFPHVGVTVEADSQSTLIRKLRDGTLDLGFVFDSVQSSDLEITEVARIPLVLVSTTADSTVEQALRDGYMLVDWGTSFAIAHAQHFPAAPSPRLRFGLGRLALAYLLSQGGSVYMAEPMVEDYLATGRVHRVAGAPAIERRAYAARRIDHDKASLIDDTLSYFR